MTLQPPAFIAFTGVDGVELKSELIALSARYPIEWGLLIDDEQTDNPLFASAELRDALLSGRPLRWAAHICGALAARIARGEAPSSISLAGFQRVQVNHSFSGSNESHIANSSLFGRRHGVRSVLQCLGAFPMDLRVDWLFDTSFGKGAAPSAWPSLPSRGPFCGFSGGLNPNTVRPVLERIAAPQGALYWIDMESGVRTNGRLDIEKCEAVCRAVYD